MLVPVFLGTGCIIVLQAVLAVLAIRSRMGLTAIDQFLQKACLATMGIRCLSTGAARQCGR